MATFTERLKIVLDLEGQKVETGLKKIRDGIKEAEGFTGKLTAGVKGVSEAFFGSPAAMAGAATVAGAALVKVTTEASDLGIEIGKLSDATGLSTEQASRWVEVAKDMGIGSDTLAGLLEKMEKNIGASPDKFKELGIFIQHASDGTVDMNATMLLAVDRLNAIQDPTQRAAAEASLFGKSWASASELLKMSSSDIKARLEDVGSSKVYSTQQVKDARAFRDSMQELKNVGEDLAIELGKDLLPAVVALANGAIAAAKGVERVVDAAARVGQQGTKTHFDELKALIDKYGDAVWKSKYAIDHHIGSVEDWIRENGFGKLSIEDFTKSVEDHRSKTLDAVSAQGEARQATFDLAEGQANAEQAAKDLAAAQDAVKKASEDSQKAVEDLAKAEDDIYKSEYDHVQAKKDYATSLVGISDALKGKDSGKSLADALHEAADKFSEMNGVASDSQQGTATKLQWITDMENLTKKGSPSWNALEDFKNELLGIQTAAQIKVTTDVVGLNAQAQNSVDGTVQLAMPDRGNNTYNIYIDVKDPSPKAVLNAITEWERRNGKGWRQ